MTPAPDLAAALTGAVHSHAPADELAGLGEAYVLHGDARALPLPRDSVDLVVTSPPYYGLRNYEDAGETYADQIGAEATLDGYVTSLLDATAEAVRVLKPTGSLFVNLGDKYSDRAGPAFDGSSDAHTKRYGKPNRINTIAVAPRKSLLGVPWRYALRCVDELGLILREELIWTKPNGLPESVTDRCRRNHETWFHFTKSPRYYAAIDELRVPHTKRDADLHPAGALPSSVWEVPTEPLHLPPELGVDHYAAFPTEWPRRLITGWCPPAGVVLDPFGGTGTTALVARALGRVGITLDASRDYCRIAQWRITASDGHYKARGVKPPKDKPVVGQLGFDLLGGEAS